MNIVQDISDYLKRRNARLDARGAELVDTRRILGDMLKPWREDAKGIAKSIKKWEPQKHPRDEDGQFTSTGGSSEVKEEKKEVEKKESEEKKEQESVESKKPVSVKETRFKRNGDSMEISEDTVIDIHHSNKKVTLLKGQLDKVIDFAGGKTGKPIREIDKLVQKYGGKPEDWSKVAGDAYILDPDGNKRRVEVHFYEANGKQVKWKVKYWNVREKRK